MKVPIFGGFPVENPTKKANRLKALLRVISLSEYGSERFRVRLRRLSEYGSVACLVERPKRETRAEQKLGHRPKEKTTLWAFFGEMNKIDGRPRNAFLTHFVAQFIVAFFAIKLGRKHYKAWRKHHFYQNVGPKKVLQRELNGTRLMTLYREEIAGSFLLVARRFRSVGSGVVFFFSFLLFFAFSWRPGGSLCARTCVPLTPLLLLSLLLQVCKFY